ncbi:unnamed protein product [Meloidogyne enterolobii]|uniref:Uncharacterized protein n=1 Tax=Meloidogyne enterolobii TaxID=390850 RepID=A0ACB1A532_MELEN
MSLSVVFLSFLHLVCSHLTRKMEFRHFLLARNLLHTTTKMVHKATHHFQINHLVL